MNRFPSISFPDVRRGYVIFGPDARGPIDELALEPFDIDADSVFTANARISKVFRPTRMRIVAVLPSNINFLNVKGLRINNVEQFAKEVSALHFDTSAFAPELVVPSANTESMISLILRNYSPDPVKVCIHLEGVYKVDNA